MAENRRRLNWGTLAAFASAAALLAGAVLVMTALQERVDQSREYSHSFDGATVVVVDVDTADVQIGVSTNGRATVQARLRWNVTRQPPYLAEQLGDTVTVRARGCGFRVFGAYCEAQITIAVPAEADLRLNTDSGRVRVANLRGNVRLDVDSADLDLSGLGGPVSVRLDSGHLSAQHLASTSVEVDVDSGDVRLQFDTAPVAVRTRTDSGHIIIGVPPGSGPYGVRTNTESGLTRIDVRTGVSAQYQIDASTDSGDITVRYQTA